MNLFLYYCIFIHIAIRDISISVHFPYITNNTNRVIFHLNIALSVCIVFLNESLRNFSVKSIMNYSRVYKSSAFYCLWLFFNHIIANKITRKMSKECYGNIMMGSMTVMYFQMLLKTWDIGKSLDLINHLSHPLSRQRSQMTKMTIT